MRQFRYIRDEVFLAGVSLYALNRWAFVPRWSGDAPWLADHFGDVLLIPCALPLLLWLQRRTGLRTHDEPPTRGEIFGALALWAALFEWGFPRWLGRGVADPLDVLAYAGGALLAASAWVWRYRGLSARPSLPARHSSFPSCT